MTDRRLPSPRCNAAPDAASQHARKRARDLTAWIVAAVATAAWLVTACSSVRVEPRLRDGPPDDAPGSALPVARLAPGVYVHVGRQEDSNPLNAGDIANNGFIVGSRCTAVIDTGGSLQVGERLRTAIRAITATPICYVINTHMHPDHVLGNAAFAPDHPQFIGHAHLAAALAAREQAYLRAARRDLGAAGESAAIIPPTRSVSDSVRLDLGDREIELRAWPTAHTDNDLTVFDPGSGTLFAGDLLFVGRIPALDGSLRGWAAAGAELERLAPDRVVPGHGPPDADWRTALAAQQRYLSALLDGTRAALRAHRTLAQATDEVATQERGRWLLFEGYHRRNVTAAFAELEWED